MATDVKFKRILTGEKPSVEFNNAPYRGTCSTASRWISPGTEDKEDKMVPVDGAKDAWDWKFGEREGKVVEV